MQTVKYYIPYIFKFNTQNIQSGTLPGTSEICNGIWIYNADKKQTKTLVEELFTDKVEESENTNEISNTVVNETTKDSSNTTTSKTTQEKLKVELLREQRKELQKQADYCTNASEKVSLENEINKISKTIKRLWLELADSEDEVETKRKDIISKLKAESMKKITDNMIFEVEFEVI